MPTKIYRILVALTKVQCPNTRKESGMIEVNVRSYVACFFRWLPMGILIITQWALAIESRYATTTSSSTLRQQYDTIDPDGHYPGGYPTTTTLKLRETTLTSITQKTTATEYDPCKSQNPPAHCAVQSQLEWNLVCTSPSKCEALTVDVNTWSNSGTSAKKETSLSMPPQMLGQRNNLDLSCANQSLLTGINFEDAKGRCSGLTAIKTRCDTQRPIKAFGSQIEDPCQDPELSVCSSYGFASYSLGRNIVCADACSAPRTACLRLGPAELGGILTL